MKMFLRTRIKSRLDQPDHVDDALSSAEVDAGASRHVRADARHDLMMLDCQPARPQGGNVAIRQPHGLFARLPRDAESVHAFARRVLQDWPQPKADEHVDA